jgi:mannose-6-phosphate isomerase-like protein (cupin superfamily)
MPREDRAPRFLDVIHGDAETVRDTPYGQVGTIYSDRAIEMVWVSKQGEAIDPGWVCQDFVDLLVVLQGRLKVEFQSESSGRIMKPGEVMVLPPRTRCRAYRWPRNATKATIFLAVYPREEKPQAHSR